MTAENLRLLACMTWLLCALPARAQRSEPESSEAPTAASTEPPSEAAAPELEALSLAELEGLGLEEARVDTDLHFWGFADFTSSLIIRPKGTAAFAQGRHQNFYVGNFNVYLSKNLSESFRTMGEVRFSYMPNGNFSLGPSGLSQVDTSTVDYANGQSVTRWGGILIERVYLEWTLHRYITARGGQFLTPLGIWNVDHGSPAYIPAQRPLAIVTGLFPQRQTGIEVLGHWSASNAQTLGYHLTLSNGTGPISEYKDLDRNKAIGGRLYWEYFGPSYVRAGVSGYYGRDTNATPTANLSNGKTDLANKLDWQSDNLTLAADVLLRRGGLQLQAEWITQQRRYTKAGRVAHSVYGAPVASGASADTLSWAGYVLAAYRFGWYAITPYVTYQAAKQTQSNQTLPDARFELSGATVGLTVHPVESVVFKAEFGSLRFPQAAALLKDTVNVVQLQAAWAF